MKILKDLKERVEALYQLAEENKCQETFQDAMDLQFQYDMTVLDYKYGLPND
ncbi:hypothetical protein KK120_18745 [Virgibacillus dakarensis]|nr:hypothetical protein [Virgibacillus dakarensis]